MEILEKFYVVTASGLHEVLVRKSAEGYSLRFKDNAWRSERQGEKDYRECWDLGETPLGSFIGISYWFGIMLLDPSYTRLEKPGQLPPYVIEDFNYNVAGTGYAHRMKPVVGMFLDWNAATNCFDVSYSKAWHERWWRESRGVLEMMKKYPFFIYDREMAKRLS